MLNFKWICTLTLFSFSSGLTLKLFKEDLFYLSAVTPGGGFRVVVHPFGTIPYPLEDGISISPGKETFIGLKFVSEFQS